MRCSGWPRLEFVALSRFVALGSYLHGRHDVFCSLDIACYQYASCQRCVTRCSLQ
jgi:hypothetical protein